MLGLTRTGRLMPLSPPLCSRASSLVCSLLAALLVTALLALWLQQLYLEKNEASSARRLGLVGHYVDEKISRLDSVLQQLSLSSDPCGKAAFDYQRRALIENPYVVDIFFLSDDAKRQCGSSMQKQQSVNARLFSRGEGLQMTGSEAASPSGSPVFYLYRALSHGGYVAAMLPTQILTSVLTQGMPPIADGYMALVSSQHGEPLRVEPQRPGVPLVHSQLFHVPLDHYLAQVVDGYWVQAMPLAHVPSVTLVNVANVYELSLLPWPWIGGLLGCLLLTWAGVYWGYGLWGRYRSHPGRMLRVALRRGEFFNVYQPIRNGFNGRLLGFEVLMRWRTKQGVIGPLHFIPAAEEQRVLVAMTRKQIEQACAALTPLLVLQPELKVSFNISTQHLLDQAFLQDSARWKQRIPHLVYELTEAEQVNIDDEQISQSLQQLRTLGIRLAVDDFGTGYSSLAYLQRMPLDILKADRCFVAELDLSSPQAPVLEAIVKLAHKLGLEIIAEGVEEAGQEQWLLLHGVVQQQGWRHGKPLTMAEGQQQWQSEMGGGQEPRRAGIN